MSKQSETTPKPEAEAQFWRLPAVKHFTQRSRSAIYRDPSFPKPVKLGPNTVAWVAEEVRAWCAARIADREAIAE
jgi:prophage regulatory protein